MNWHNVSRRRILFNFESLIQIAIGGAVGANLRYAIGTFYPGILGTFIANVSGSFLLALLLYEALYTGHIAEETRIVFGTGFLSSFTTYSTFALESAQVPFWLGLLNIVGSYAIGFSMVIIGKYVVSKLTGPVPLEAGESG